MVNIVFMNGKTVLSWCWAQSAILRWKNSARAPRTGRRGGTRPALALTNNCIIHRTTSSHTYCFLQLSIYIYIYIYTFNHTCARNTRHINTHVTPEPVTEDVCTRNYIRPSIGTRKCHWQSSAFKAVVSQHQCLSRLFFVVCPGCLRRVFSF